jgi:putative tricarboxylic transport membrane protein
MKILDIATAVFMLALSALVVVGTSNLPYWSGTTPGPAFVPRWVALAGAVLAVLLLLYTLNRKDHEPVEWPHAEAMRRVLLTGATLWLFFVLLPLLGFVISGTLFMLSMLLLVERRSLVPALITTVVTMAGAYSIFGWWLAIDLPKGPFGF